MRWCWRWSLGGVSAYIGLAAHREAEHLQERTDRARSFRIQEILARFYSVNGDWDNLQPVLERTSFALGHAIILLDGDGMPVARTAGVTFDSDEMHRADFTPVMVDGKQVGSVYIEPDSRHSDRDRFGRRGSSRSSGLAGVTGGPFPVETGAFEEPLWSRFAEVTNRSLLWAGAAAGSAGLLLISLTSRRMLRSVRMLTSAARRMGDGDLSQRVPAEGRDEIGELARTFNAMADGLESAERQRRSMVADAAHELRTPLSNIRGYVEAVRDGVLKPDPETLGTIHQQVLYLTDLVDDLRLLAETEAGDFGLNREPGSLFEVVRTSVEGVRAQGGGKGRGLGGRSSGRVAGRGVRPDQDIAGGRQPFGQCDTPHSARRHGHGIRQRRTRGRHGVGGGHGRRYARGGCPLCLRTLLPSRPISQPVHRRRGPRPYDCQAVG